MAYLLDSNVFIRAKNEYYGFDICPGFWDWLDHSFEQRKVLSVEAIYDELAPQQDDLAAWVRARPNAFLDAMNDEVLNAANQFGVRVVQPYQMLRELGARFVYQRPTQASSLF